MRIMIDSDYIENVLPKLQTTATIVYLIILYEYRKNGNRPVCMSFDKLKNRTMLSIATLRRSVSDLRRLKQIEVKRLGIGRETETYYTIMEARGDTND